MRSTSISKQSQDQQPGWHFKTKIEALGLEAYKLLLERCDARFYL
jgi:hypothetical protein